MVDSGPYPSDGEGRPSRKPRHDQRSGRTGAQDRESGHHDGHGRNREERSQNRDRRQDGEDRGARRSREDLGREQYQKKEQHREERGQRDRGRDREDRGHSRSHPEKSRYKDRVDYQSEKSSNQHQGRDYQSEKSSNQHQGRDYQSEKSYNQHHGRDYQSEKSSNQHQGRDYQSEKSYNQHHGRDYQSEKSYNQHHGREDYHKERSQNRYEERPHVRYADSPDQLSYPMDSKVPSERSFPPNGAEMQELEYYEGGGILDCHKCKYLCTGRACCQLVEVLLNMLILICCAISYNSTGGYTGISSLGGIYYYQFGGAYNGFSGADGDRAQVLDVEFYNLKLPSVRASMAFGGALMTFCCLLVLLGVLRVPWRWPVWLLVECVVNIAIAIGYIPALYFYFQHLQEAYNSQVCKDREALYSSKGYKGFTCGFHAGDIGAALFACMAIIVFAMSAVLAIKGFRTVRRMKKKPVNTLEF